MKPIRLSYARLPLRFKLTVAFTMVIGATCALAFSYLPHKLAEESIAALTDKAQTIAQMTAYGASPAIVFSDSAGIAEAVESAWMDPDIVAITIVDEAGTVLLSNRRAADERAVSAVAIVEHAGRTYGAVHTELSTWRADRGVAEARSRIAAFSLIVFGVSAWIALVMSSLITRPLAKVSAAASQIASSGHFARVDVRARDEVGTLADTFNVMVDRLALAHADLSESNRLLEQRVLERTSALESQVRERRRAEKELRISEHRFRTIFEAAGAGIALLAPDGAVVDVNRALRQMIGEASGDLVGAHITRVVAVDDRARLTTEIARIARGEAVEARLELVLPHDDGMRFTLCMLSPVVVDATGSPHVLVVVEDVTEQRELAERYRQAQKLEAVGRLAGGIAHDFNNLLMTINGVCDLLLGDLDDGSVRRDVEQVRGAGERAAQLTRQLLAFSRRQVLRDELVDINEVVREVTAMLGRVIGETITLDTHLEQPLSPVRADPGQILQVVMNLAVNARDAMPDGGRLSVTTSHVTVDDALARRFALPDRGEYVCLSVQDTGRGMDEAAQAHAFEPFFTTKPAGEGTGLGLATVYGIVRQSKGGVAFESAPGAGTTFQVLLPAAPGTARRKPPPQPTRPEPATETVLVAEDEAAVRALVCRVLRRQGYNVLEAADGEAALEVADAHPGTIALLLSDVVMPRRSGPELAVSLHERRPDTRVVFMSGYTPDDMRARGLSEHADAILEKPMSPATLIETLRTVLERAGAERRRAEAVADPVAASA